MAHPVLKNNVPTNFDPIVKKAYLIKLINKVNFYWTKNFILLFILFIYIIYAKLFILFRPTMFIKIYQKYFNLLPVQAIFLKWHFLKKIFEDMKDNKLFSQMQTYTIRL